MGRSGCRTWCCYYSGLNDMEITCISVPGGWQTMVYLFNDKKAYPFGPVFNKTTDLWDWQRANLFDVAKGYRLMKEAV